MSYTGKCLYVDITLGKVDIRDTEKDLCTKYIGGKGLGFALMKKYAPCPEPFGPENPVIFVNGPFTGTKIQTSARTCLVTRSPLTGSLLDSHCGGNFGPAMHRAGFDYIYITGKAAKPSYLYVTDQKIEIRDAAHLWGKGIFETNDILIAENQGINPRVAAIGPAGENLSKIACTGVDKHRQYGRGGSGAVLGSKNLKAVVCDGTQEVKYHNEELFNELNKQLTKDILNHPGVKFRREKGTMKCVRSGQANEFLPTKNYKEVVFEDFEGISSETARKELNWEDTSCFNCAIRCSKWARWDNHEVEGPEYETTAFFGSGCLVSDIKDVTWANEICNDLGFDTISAGVTMSFAMECFEKELAVNWDGVDMKWGNAAAQREMLTLMAHRKGVGDLFADGTRVAAQKIGQGSDEFAINTFGMEHSGVNPKGCLTMALVMSVADFASHTRLWATEQEMGEGFAIEDIPPTVVEGIDTVNARNSLIICDFVPFGFDRLAPVLNAATGYNYTEADLQRIGTSITHLAREYNTRNGRTTADDTLPGRFFNEEHLAGFMRGKKLDRAFHRSLVEKYYELRNWDENGIPTEAVMAEFGI
ncbi:MAG: aldehyde ferredoxin oxidoreductase family protein [Bacteroidetes bacterium]|nr:aldehyde ferredoxin oxidoreductase family protein [Bacteroidota bacterium]MBU1717960.1 aldehyde ferredoxin oxidoreductase family protein [Bacteroidota bacterium]